MQKSCSSCGYIVQCTNNESCWCSDFPPILTVEESSDCLCKSCIHSKIKSKISTLLSSDEGRIFAQSLGEPKALMQEIDYYISENGLLVFSSWYLLRRGYCCKNGCKNCPY